MSVFVDAVCPGEGAGAALSAHDELAAMTVKELNELCGELGIDVPSKAKKADIVSAIESADSSGGEQA